VRVPGCWYMRVLRRLVRSSMADPTSTESCVPCRKTTPVPTPVPFSGSYAPSFSPMQKTRLRLGLGGVARIKEGSRRSRGFVELGSYALIDASREAIAA
jgi:hypothetical protein